MKKKQIVSSHEILGPATKQYTKQQVKFSLRWPHKLMSQTSKWVHKDKKKQKLGNNKLLICLADCYNCHCDFYLLYAPI